MNKREKKIDYPFLNMQCILGSSISYTVIEDYPQKFVLDYALGTGKIYKRCNKKYMECDLYMHYVDDILDLGQDVLIISMYRAEILPSKISIDLDTTGYWYTTKEHVVFFQCMNLFSLSLDVVTVYDKEFHIVSSLQKTSIVDMVQDTKTDIIYTCSKPQTCSLIFRHHIKGDIFSIYTVQPHRKIFSTGRFDQYVYFVQYIDTSIYFYDTNGEYINHISSYPHIMKIEHIQNYVYSVLYLQKRVVVMNLQQRKNAIQEFHDYCIIVDYDYSITPCITDDECFLIFLQKQEEASYLCVMQLYEKFETYVRQIEDLSYSCLSFDQNTIRLGTNFGAIVEFGYTLTELVPE